MRAAFAFWKITYTAMRTELQETQHLVNTSIDLKNEQIGRRLAVIESLAQKLIHESTDPRAAAAVKEIAQCCTSLGNLAEADTGIDQITVTKVQQQAMQVLLGKVILPEIASFKELVMAAIEENDPTALQEVLNTIPADSLDAILLSQDETERTPLFAALENGFTDPEILTRKDSCYAEFPIKRIIS